MSAAIHGAEIMVQCSRNDSKQITLLHGVIIQTVVQFLLGIAIYMHVYILCIDTPVP